MVPLSKFPNTGHILWATRYNIEYYVYIGWPRVYDLCLGTYFGGPKLFKKLDFIKILRNNYKKLKFNFFLLYCDFWPCIPMVTEPLKTGHRQNEKYLDLIMEIFTSVHPENC